MKQISKITATIFLSLSVLSSCGDRNAEISEDILRDKVKGAWAAKMIGVEYGMPFEFRHCGTIWDGEITWTPEMVEGALRQDDIYVQMNFMKTLEDLGLDAPADSLAKNLANAQFPLCHANLQARKNWFDGIPAEKLSLPENNIHGEDIDFQIEADFIGIINPGMQRSATALAERIGCIMSHADGLYGGIFVAAMTSAAYFAETPFQVISEAMKSIPSESTYAECIRDVLNGYQSCPDDWRSTWKTIEDKWGSIDICTPYIPFNIDAKINGAYIVIALLYGGGDFEKTMEVAVRCGQDTDCNASSAAAILGILYGYEAIPEKFKSHIDEIADEKFLFTDYSFNDAVEKSLDFIRLNVVSAGGKITDGIYAITRQAPSASELQTGFSSQRLSYVLTVGEIERWNFDENWNDFAYNIGGDNAPYKVAAAPGAEMTVDFEGTGFALLGSWNSDCGKAKIYVDGEFQKEIDTYFREEAGLYEGNRAYLCHLTGFPKGKHTVRVVVSEDRNPKSAGCKIYIEKMLVYE